MDFRLWRGAEWTWIGAPQQILIEILLFNPVIADKLIPF